jgi:hypothetical protein
LDLGPENRPGDSSWVKAVVSADPDLANSGLSEDQVEPRSAYFTGMERGSYPVGSRSSKWRCASPFRDSARANALLHNHLATTANVLARKMGGEAVFELQ